jgi:hypothetical protein
VVVPSGGGLVAPSPGGPVQRECEAGAGDESCGVPGGQAREPGGLGDRQPDRPDAVRAGLARVCGDRRVAEGYATKLGVRASASRRVNEAYTHDRTYPQVLFRR